MFGGHNMNMKITKMYTTQIAPVNNIDREMQGWNSDFYQTPFKQSDD